MPTPVEAHLADGTVLQFPEGTDPGVVSLVVKKHLSNQYETSLSPQEETQFQGWKQKYAPKDSGADYDLRGAFKAGLTPDPQTGHWSDTYKKPNHPTFSNESQYAKDAPQLAGHWVGDTYVKPGAEDPLSLSGTLKAFAKQAPQGLAMLGGIASGPLGAAAGASFGQAAKNIAPSVFGEPGSAGEQVANAGVDTLTQGVLPQVVGNILKYGVRGAAAAFPGATKLPAVKIAELINKAKGYMMPESSLVETAAENARLNAPSLKIPITRNVESASNLLDASGNPIDTSQSFRVAKNNPVYSTPAGKMIMNVESEAPAFHKITPTAKEIMSDIQSVRNAKLATGDPTIVRQIAANDLVTRNYSKAADSINPGAILDEIGKRPDVYEEAFGKPALDTFTDLMKTAQDKGVGKVTDLASWREGRKALYVSIPFHAAGALGVPEAYAAGAVASSIVLTKDALKAVASNPRLGQMIIQATKTNAAAPEAGFLSKAVLMGLRGTTLYLQTPDGKQKVQVGENGELQNQR